jgi:hypothetical protein
MALPQRREARPDRDWRAHYEIENPDEVEAYVAEHPSVTAILAEAPNEIRLVFGPAVDLRLRFERDPGNGDSWLFIGVPWADVGPSVLPLIDKLDEIWSLNPTTAHDTTVVVDVVSL